MKLKEEIKVAMVKKNLSQRELANLLGVTQQMVSAWEKGEPVAERHWKVIQEEMGIDVSLFSNDVDGDVQTITQTAADNARQQAHTGAGNVSMFDRDGITLTGYDQRNPPPAVDADAWAELMHWIIKHPSMVPSLAIKARELGSAADEVFGFR